MAVTVLKYKNEVFSRGPAYAVSFTHWYSLKL